MSRLFIKIKADTKLKGTLLELSRESKISEAITQITSNMEGIPRIDEAGQPLDYRFVRLGSPKRVLENDQTFAQENVKNSDVLLISTDPESVMSQGLFDFEALTIENQYTSVQDLRAPIRMFPQFSSGVKKTAVKSPKSQSPDDGAPVSIPTEPNTTKEKKKSSESPFDFQPLDIQLPDDEHRMDDQFRTKRTAGRSKKKK